MPFLRGVTSKCKTKHIVSAGKYFQFPAVNALLTLKYFVNVDFAEWNESHFFQVRSWQHQINIEYRNVHTNDYFTPTIPLFSFFKTILRRNDAFSSVLLIELRLFLHFSTFFSFSKRYRIQSYQLQTSD